MFAIGNDELDKLPKVGKTVRCPKCTKKHRVNYGTDSDGKKSLVLGFIKHGKVSYLVSIDEKEL